MHFEYEIHNVKQIKVKKEYFFMMECENIVLWDLLNVGFTH